MAKKLTAKQQVFIEEYLKCWNATEAARRADYAHPNMAGPRLLVNDSVAARVEERLNEVAMEANEVLYHLANIARGDMDNLIDRNGLPDIQSARTSGNTGLIKRWKFRTVTTENSDIHEIEVEPYDRLDALKTLAKVHRLTNQRIEHTGADGSELTVKVIYEDALASDD